jgi:Ca-activated chloride channel family protein
MSAPGPNFAPVAAATGRVLKLAMQRLWLKGQLLSAGGRLVVQHVFESAEDGPLEVIYSFPLPRDASLRAFRIVGEGFEAHSELRPREEAVRTYEKGIAEGALAALARQYGDGLVNLTVGNIRPREAVTVFLEILAGVELRDGGYRFRFPFTLAPSYHAGMRVSTEADEGEIELPEAEFGDVILPPFRRDAGALHKVGFDLSIAHGLPISEIASPSHAIVVRQPDGAQATVALSPAQDVPNRDLVLDVRYRQEGAEVLSGLRDGKRPFAAIVPSTAFGPNTDAPRRVVFLLDRSGSMQGEPIAQARKAIEACLATMTEQDQFLLLAFDDRVETMDAEIAPATRERRDAARKFLEGVNARGGTQLAAAVSEAARAAGPGGDIVVITDGQVFGSEAILAQARAAGVRLSCLGIGSASQDRFLTLLARETGGVSRFVTPRERVDLAAVDLFASIGRPVASGLKCGAEVQPEAPSTVFAGTPVLLYGEIADDAEPRIDFAWAGGSLRIDIPPGDAETAETVRLLRGARLITDWEARCPAVEASAPLEKRRESRVAARLTELSETYGLASREMALVAVVHRKGDRPGDLPETRVVPVGLAQDVSADAYFPQPMRAAILAAAPRARHALGLSASRLMEFTGLQMAQAGSMKPAESDPLVELAAMLEPDGGMPGSSDSERTVRSIAALLAFLHAGHTATSGAFRLHVARLVAFLRALHPTSDKERLVIEKALAAAAAGRGPRGHWLRLAWQPGAGWEQLERLR